MKDMKLSFDKQDVADYGKIANVGVQAWVDGEEGDELKWKEVTFQYEDETELADKLSEAMKELNKEIESWL